MSTTPEGKVKAGIKSYLRSIGAYYFMPVQTGYGATTIDFLVCYQGRFYGIETKRKGVTKASPLQRNVINQIVKAGGIAFVADCVETVQQVLNSPLPVLPAGAPGISPGGAPSQPEG